MDQIAKIVLKMVGEAVEIARMEGMLRCGLGGHGNKGSGRRRAKANREQCNRLAIALFDVIRGDNCRLRPTEFIGLQTIRH